MDGSFKHEDSFLESMLSCAKISHIYKSYTMASMNVITCHVAQNLKT